MGRSTGTPPPSKDAVNRKTQLCAYWKDGRCTRGRDCTYAHGDDELTKDRHGRSSRQEFQDLHRKLMSEKKPEQRRRSRSRSRRPNKKVSFAKKDGIPSSIRRECKVVETRASASITVDDQEAPLPAPFLLNEDGLGYLTTCYGVGVSILQAMGWKAGSGIGRRSEGWLEPVSVKTLEGPALHRGRKDRRCIGVEPPKRFIDSDASESAAASESDARSRQEKKRRRSSSSKRSRSRGSGKKKRRKRRRKEKKRRSSSSSSSKSSSGSSSSEDSRTRRRKKLKRARMRATQPPPKPEAKAAGASTAGAAGAKAGAAGGVPQAAVPVPQGEPVNEPPEIALAKKKVLAKLTTLKNIEPKEQRAKAFRELLREWHPDKNPERIEMATAVFQFLQKGKSLLSLGAAAK